MEDIVYEVTGGVGRITLNRPDKLNALRVTTFEELERALRDAGGDPEVGVVLIAGAGRAFCAGGDLGMAQATLTDERAARKHYFGRMMALSQQVLMMDKPVICAVQGACVGGGAELTTFADLVIAGRSAFFKFNGTEIGGCSWWGAPQLLPLQIGLRRTEEILLLSSRVGAEEAAEIGMINRVVADDDLWNEAERVCEQILDLSEDGVRLTKAALRSIKESMLTSMTASAEMNVSALAKPDLHAAFDAFLEGRPMSWRALRPGQSVPLDGAAT
ncbi:MAG: enoyl-CoA hydratase/isomerase family protein [Solirubrobacterales bacterium]|nr:enoyl-CoA hydratase/isomerase family protein [Solirubrobacterales bacterium]